MTPHGQKKIDDPTQHDTSEKEYTYRGHLQNMLAIIAENREVLKIEPGSPLHKEIVAARKFVIENNGDANVEQDARV